MGAQTSSIKGFSIKDTRSSGGGLRRNRPVERRGWARVSPCCRPFGLHPIPLINESGDSRSRERRFARLDNDSWTLPSNQFVAVHPDLDYAIVSFIDQDGARYGNKVIVASALTESIATKLKMRAEIGETLKGTDLLGLRYLPPYDCFYKDLGQKKGTLKEDRTSHIAWYVCPGDFVTLDSGTGLVHEAPAFGEVDFDTLTAEQARFVAGEGPELICAVAANGTFTSVIPEYEGRWVKDCDKEITQELKRRGILFHLEQYLHDYPFCWRATDDPLIQYPRKSWFIRTTQYKDKMLANNEKINWIPEHIRTADSGTSLRRMSTGPFHENVLGNTPPGLGL